MTMKKQLIFLAAIPMACFCSKEQPVAPEVNADGKVEIVATVADTKVAIAQGDGVLNLTWESGDALKVCGTTSGTFTLSEGEGEARAVFTGDAVEGTTFDVFYPATYADKAALVARSYKNQVQTGNGNTDHLEWNGLVEGLSAYNNVDFSADGAKLNGVLKLVVKLPDDVEEVSSVSLIADSDIFYETNGTDAKTNSIDLAFAETTVTDNVLTAYAMTSWQPVTITPTDKLSIEVTVPGATGVYSASFHNKNNLTLAGGSCLTIDLTGLTVLEYSGMTGTGTEDDPYIIKNAAQLDNVRNLIVASQVVYFKLGKDIDLSSIASWTPISTANALYPVNFDGQGYTIRNLTIKNNVNYPSLFGLVTGTVKNINFDNCNISVSSGSHAAVLAGWVGNNGHTLGDQYIENIHATNCNVSNGGTGVAAGLFGNIGWATVKNCSYKGTVTGGTGKAAGIVGQVYGAPANSIENCSFEGTITTDGRYMAGIIGQSSPKSGTTECLGLIKGCTVKGTLSSTVDLAGGIVAWIASGTVEDCVVEADITVVKNTGNNYAYLGGIVGYNTANQPKMYVKNCSYKGALSSKGTCNAGIFGDSSSPVEITGCSAVGTHKGTKGYSAGIIAYCTKTGPATVKDCYANFVINDASGQSFSGNIVADASTNTVVENCYARGAVNGGYGLGGIVGRASNITNLDGSNNKDLGITVKKCITDADVKTVTVANGYPGESPSAHYSIGAVVGYTAFQNTMADCFRKADMEFFGYSSNYNGTGLDMSSHNELYDQENSGPGTPLVELFTDATNDKWFCPYHGKAYTGYASTKAAALGWSTEVWDLSGSVPQLKKFPDSTLK